MSDGFTAGADTADRLHALAEQILGTVERPKDHWEVAAHLEVAGIRDVDARTEYQCADVFDLARRIMAIAGEVEPPPPERRKRQVPMVWRFIRTYIRGLVFSMPMATQIFAMTLFGYSLWAWVGFSLREATAIGLGTLTSFVVTGGFTQAISRRGLFYINQKEDILTKKVCYRIFSLGLVSVFAVGLLLFVVNAVLEVLPTDMVLYAHLYYFLLSILWLSFSILYMLGQEILFTLITAVGIAAVHLAILVLRTSMVAAHAIGMIAAILLSFTAGWVILARRARQAQREYTGTELPRPSILVYATASYFWYGVLYFAFLFADRFIAWTSESGRGALPFFVWFETRYELGMDWALLGFVLTVGVLEFTIQEFSDRIIPTEQLTRADEVARFNRRFTRFYYAHLLLFVVVSLIAIGLAWFGMRFLRGTGVFPFMQVFFNPTTESVFWWAAVGYVFLVFGLFNSVFLFALSRPAFILRSLAPALLLNLVVGFVLSRAVRYDLAVVGLTTGAIAFMLISSFYTRRTFRRLDYYYYSAY